MKSVIAKAYVFLLIMVASSATAAEQSFMNKPVGKTINQGIDWINKGLAESSKWAEGIISDAGSYTRAQLHVLGKMTPEQYRDSIVKFSSEPKNVIISAVVATVITVWLCKRCKKNKKNSNYRD